MRKVEPFYALSFIPYQDLGYRVANNEVVKKTEFR